MTNRITDTNAFKRFWFPDQNRQAKSDSNVIATGVSKKQLDDIISGEPLAMDGASGRANATYAFRGDNLGIKTSFYYASRLNDHSNAPTDSPLSVVTFVPNSHIIRPGNSLEVNRKFAEHEGSYIKLEQNGYSCRVTGDVKQEHIDQLFLRYNVIEGVKVYNQLTNLVSLENNHLSENEIQAQLRLIAEYLPDKVLTEHLPAGLSIHSAEDARMLAAKDPRYNPDQAEAYRVDSLDGTLTTSLAHYVKLVIDFGIPVIGISSDDRERYAHDMPAYEKLLLQNIQANVDPNGLNFTMIGAKHDPRTSDVLKILKKYDIKIAADYIKSE